MKAGNSSQVHWDENLAGFGVRVYESGARVYVCKYRIEGKQFVDTLGAVELISLEQARESARRTLIRAYNDRAATSATERLFSEFGAEYIDRYSKSNVPDWENEEHLYKLHIREIWGDRPISSLRKTDVIALVKTANSISPDLANRLKLLVCRVWEAAASWGYVDEALKNPTVDIPDTEILNIDATAGETDRLFAAIETERHYFARAAMLVLLYSGLHKSECIDARWVQVDWALRTITVQRIGNKAKRNFTMPLGEVAFAILQSMPKHPDNPYIFCGRDRGLPIDDFDERWERVRILAGISGIRLPALRHLVISATTPDGDTVGRVMGLLGYKQS